MNECFVGLTFTLYYELRFLQLLRTKRQKQIVNH